MVFGHHRLSVNPPQVSDGDLAGTEAAQVDPVLELAQPLGDSRLEIGCGHLNLEFRALRPVGKGLGDFHDEKSTGRPIG